MAALRQFPWPGNIRELKHVIERAILAAPAEAVEINISLGPAAAPAADVTAPMKGLPPEGISLAQWERAMIEQALKEAGGNQAKAARLLGVSRDTLRYRVAKFKITP